VSRSKQNVGAREKSPAEQLAASARALSPVRFFLRPTDAEEYPSFSSLGTTSSYDYQQEEEFVKKAQKTNGRKGKAEDMPYRPADDDWAGDSDESGGEGIVRSGALNGRAETRGQRRAKGEGYLGMGVGIQPPRLAPQQRAYRSPTPVEMFARALTPQEDRGVSQAPAPRTVATNLLYGMLLGLKMAIEAVLGTASRLISQLAIKPLKKVLQRARKDWWKVLGTLLCLSLAIRLANRSTNNLAPQTVDLVDRLAHLERAIQLLSDSSRHLSDAERIGTHVDDDILARLATMDQALSKYTDLDKLTHRVSNLEKVDSQAVIEGLLPKYLPIQFGSQGKVDVHPEVWTKLLASVHSEVDMMLRQQSNPTQEHLRHMVEEEVRRSALKSSGGSDPTPLLHDMITAALLKYSKDTLALPDYALFTAGARIVPSITTDTLVMRSANVLERTLLGRKNVEGRSPATALHPDISVGNCWPFKGDQAQLGVLLTRRIVVTAITIEHASKDVALDVSTAPREVQVVSSRGGYRKLIFVVGHLGRVRKQGENERVSSSRMSKLTCRDEAPDHLSLGTFTYDPSAPSHIQTFKVDPAIVDLGVDVGVVIFRVNSNWGGDLTCLYRVSTS
jgi:SUN domain-containing protein 1/2